MINLVPVSVVGNLADQVCFTIDAKISDKQKLLETLKISERLKAATDILLKK